jgi:hypothetical protein
MPCVVFGPRSVTDGVVEIRNSYAVPHNEANGQARGMSWRQQAVQSRMRSARASPKT